MNRISTIAVPLGVGSLILSTVLAASAVYLALQRPPELSLLLTTACAHGALALSGVLFGIVAMFMRGTVSAGRIELAAANAVRRDLLVLWNLGILMACLGWLALGASAAQTPTPIVVPSTLFHTLLSATLVVYDGAVTVFAYRLLRS
ncbi:hypothetical protein [Amycolatopsis marina]|uniref:hypothetical protein n=1 Tax=Amycolatopsis marina TaxID=490629 RepID=UPI001FE57D52|nr:hypothetical protein [Amycolatopsis marina]